MNTFLLLVFVFRLVFVFARQILSLSIHSSRHIGFYYSQMSPQILLIFRFFVNRPSSKDQNCFLAVKHANWFQYRKINSPNIARKNPTKLGKYVVCSYIVLMSTFQSPRSACTAVLFKRGTSCNNMLVGTCKNGVREREGFVIPS